MACKFIVGDGFTAFQCTPGKSLLKGDFIEAVKDRKKPYDELECRHTNRTEMSGVLTCLDCCATYNENLFQWEENNV